MRKEESQGNVEMRVLQSGRTSAYGWGMDDVQIRFRV